MKKTSVISLALGILIGASILSPLAQAAEDWLRATPSAQKFFVNGKRVELEAYAIGGYNYVKLRDIGQAADFSVSYDPMANAGIVAGCGGRHLVVVDALGGVAPEMATPFAFHW